MVRSASIHSHILSTVFALLSTGAFGKDVFAKFFHEGEKSWSTIRSKDRSNTDMGYDLHGGPGMVGTKPYGSKVREGRRGDLLDILSISFDLPDMRIGRNKGSAGSVRMTSSGEKIGMKGNGNSARYRDASPQSFQGGQSVVIAPTEMNVLYRGLDNPISICVPGKTAGELSASLSNGNLKRQGGCHYTARPGSGNKGVIKVTNRMTGRSLGEMKFRIKDVPPPKPYFAGNSISDEAVKKERLAVADQVNAEMHDFLFDIHYTVVEFEVGATIGGQFPTEKRTGGNQLTARQRSLLKSVSRGGRVEIRNIVALDPSGKRRNLPSMSFRVQ